MNRIYLSPKEERQLYFKLAADAKNIPLEIIEKDYWVVFILERLFSIQNLKPYLTFKGGTSLSKVYGLINRFSEDIDLSIEREFFGINDPQAASSRKKRNDAIANLASTCNNYVQKELLDALKAAITAKLETNPGWHLSIDEENTQTLLFAYESEANLTNYIRPIIRIEIGARSEHWPVSEYSIQSYVKEILEDKVYEPPVTIRVLNAERTFWEKATILHQHAHFPKTKSLPSRISRHYYDFFQLLLSQIKEKAIAEVHLLERVAHHKSIYFESAWASYNTARKGTLKLVPPGYVVTTLTNDYSLMKDMLFGTIPEWEEILDTIKSFEDEFNADNATHLSQLSQS